MNSYAIAIAVMVGVALVACKLQEIRTKRQDVADFKKPVHVVIKDQDLKRHTEVYYKNEKHLFLCRHFDKVILRNNTTLKEVHADISQISKN